MGAESIAQVLNAEAVTWAELGRSPLAQSFG